MGMRLHWRLHDCEAIMVKNWNSSPPSNLLSEGWQPDLKSTHPGFTEDVRRKKTHKKWWSKQLQAYQQQQNYVAVSVDFKVVGRDFQPRFQPPNSHTREPLQMLQSDQVLQRFLCAACCRILSRKVLCQWGKQDTMSQKQEIKGTPLVKEIPE